MGVNDVDLFLETCRNQLHWNSELNIETEIVCQTMIVGDGKKHKCWTGLLMSRVVSTDRVETSTELK